MTITEHCPLCLRSRTHQRGRYEDGPETVTRWCCSACGHRWETRYLTAAYGDETDQLDDWDRVDGWSYQ